MVRGERLVVVLSLVLVLNGCVQKAEQTLTVFAAASLTDATERLAAAFEREHPGTQVRVSIGATSTLARQIQAGAPADVFLSVSRDWTEWLGSRELAEGGPVVLATNRLAVIASSGTAPLERLRDLSRFERLAVADPSHVPAGGYWKTVLEADSLWAVLQPVLIPMLDVRAAVAAVQTETAGAALVYLTDARAVPELALIYEVPESKSPSIRIEGVAVKGAGTEARAFLDYCVSEAGRAVWRQYGFGEVGPPLGGRL